MKDGPDIAITASMLGDPARANMVTALMSGLALTATELAREAGVTPATASGHLAKLEASGLIAGTKHGRHRYFRLADPDVADAVEALTTVASRAGHLRSRPGPKDEAMRHARSCYDHLAGQVAVDLFDHWVGARILGWRDERVVLTQKGRRHLAGHGIDVAVLDAGRRPLCRACIDWSERKNHLGGALGAAVLDLAVAKSWGRRTPGARTVAFGPRGEKSFVAWYRDQPIDA